MKMLMTGSEVITLARRIEASVERNVDVAIGFLERKGFEIEKCGLDDYPYAVNTTLPNMLEHTAPHTN